MSTLKSDFRAPVEQTAEERSKGFMWNPSRGAQSGQDHGCRAASPRPSL